MENWLLKLDRRAPRIPLNELALDFGLEHPRIAQAIMTAPFARFYLQPRNMGREACGVFGTWAGGSVSARHLAHMIQMGRLGDFAPFMQDGGRPPFTYTDGIPRITVPLVMLGGGADPIREDRLRAAIFDRVSSEHKRFIFLKEAGHVDLLFLMDLEDITGWLEERAGDA
jgi:pimeloyl-ACP methyl ester carboxylesterase